MRNNIQTRMTKSAWRSDWFSTISFTSFIAISIMMMSLTLMLFMNLTGAIEHLMEEAKTPDFLQMHVGEIDDTQLSGFAQERKDVENYQLCRFLNLENSILTIGNHSLIESTQDNGLSVQGENFDLMLGMDNEIPQVNKGQVYVPVCYQSLFQIHIGDKMKIGDETLTVAGFIRDSQMNSMMASSKRFLVCKEDYDRLSSLGSEEYLIEFLLKENADITAFQTAYENAGLPKNGPTITRALVKMMNTMSDGIMIVIILLISLLVLIIAMVCIRFMLLTRMEAESKETGILKAVGFSGKEIRRLFAKRYAWLIIIGGCMGVLLSCALYKPLSAQMQNLYGVSLSAIAVLFVSALGAAFLGIIILLFVMSILRKLNQMTALGALGRRDDEKKNRHSRLCIAIVSATAVFLMMIPTNLYSTLSSPGFVTYMGIGNGQIRMDIRQSENIKQESEKIAELLYQDSEVLEYAIYQTSSVPVTLRDGTTMNMLMEQGNHGLFPVTYSKGEAPASEGETAVSYLLAEELGLSVGDEFLAESADTQKKCKVTGIYSDITNGGKTAKIFADHLNPTEDIMWSIVYVRLKDHANMQAFTEKYTKEGAEVSEIATRVMDTYGTTLRQIGSAATLAKVIGVVVILLVITTFIRLLIENDRNRISIQKAIGFKSLDIKKRYWKSCIPYMLAGIILGGIAGCIPGEKICGIALKSLGADGFKFVFNSGEIIINLVVAFLSIVAAVYLGTIKISRIRAAECCRGRE